MKFAVIPLVLTPFVPFRAPLVLVVEGTLAAAGAEAVRLLVALALGGITSHGDLTTISPPITSERTLDCLNKQYLARGAKFKVV